jgi:hypothetical protein
VEAVAMNHENKPFNNAIDHMNKIEGNGANLAIVDMDSMPKPLKYFGYFIGGCVVFSFLLVMVFFVFKMLGF